MIEQVLIDDLVGHPKNPNRHDKEQIERLAKLITYQGWRLPIIVSKQSGYIVSGHGRLEAAKSMGLNEVPVTYQDFADDEMEYAFLVSDNSIASWAELDLSSINTHVGELGPDFDIQLLGLDNFTIDVADKNIQKIEDDDLQESSSDESDSVEPEQEDIIPDHIEPRVKIGETYVIGDHRIFNGDCLKVLRTLPGDSVDSLVTDPPAGIAFMGKEWDEDKGGSKQWIAWMSEVMSECLRVMKPGAHGFVWAIPRTSHWTATALEDAGFEIRDVVTHLFGSGFPKSLDISKAVDKQAGSKREVIDSYQRKGRSSGILGKETEITRDITLPSSTEAKQWQGWGTALKPASEHWVLIRKPCSEKTVAANVLKWGCGGINIDVSRIGADKIQSNAYRSKGKEGCLSLPGEASQSGNVYSSSTHTGRFPANLILDEVAAEMLGEPSRFFYCAKPSKREKNAGCDVNPHPTVKSTTLMTYLIKLVTPSEGTLLDCFGGSGTTLIAAHMNRFASIVIEKQPEYCDIILARAEHFIGKSAVLNA